MEEGYRLLVAVVVGIVLFPLYVLVLSASAYVGKVLALRTLFRKEGKRRIQEHGDEEEG